VSRGAFSTDVLFGPAARSAGSSPLYLCLRVSFAIDADRVQEELVPYREDPSAYLLRAARGLHDAYLENERVIERREKGFALALFALGVETLLWALTLALA
jgi:hypothetical protein